MFPGNSGDGGEVIPMTITEKRQMSVLVGSLAMNELAVTSERLGEEALFLAAKVFISYRRSGGPR